MSSGNINNNNNNEIGATKRITIETDPRKKSIYENQNIVKMFRILLTLFYGQLFANAIYDNLIRGIPYVAGTASSYGIARVTFGFIIIGLVIFSMFAIWKKVNRNEYKMSFIWVGVNFNNLFLLINFLLVDMAACVGQRCVAHRGYDHIARH